MNTIDIQISQPLFTQQLCKPELASTATFLGETPN